MPVAGGNVGVQHVAAIHIEGVVFYAPAVDAIFRAARHPDLGFILAGLITHPRGQSDQLREVAAIQAQLHDLLPGDRAGDFRVLGFDLRAAAPGRSPGWRPQPPLSWTASETICLSGTLTSGVLVRRNSSR